MTLFRIKVAQFREDKGRTKRSDVSILCEAMTCNEAFDNASNIAEGLAAFGVAFTGFETLSAVPVTLPFVESVKDRAGYWKTDGEPTGEQRE